MASDKSGADLQKTTLIFDVVFGTAVAVAGVFALRAGWATVIALARGVPPDYSTITKKTITAAAATGGAIGALGSRHEANEKPRPRALTDEATSHGRFARQVTDECHSKKLSPRL